MQQLTGQDAMFLYGETANMPMHVASLMIYDPSTAPRQPVRFKDILRVFEERIDRSAVFRRKLAHVPLGLDHPFWIEDDKFDLEFHVRHIALPKPGDWRQLCIQVARLHSRPLDRSRPLWEAYVIEGLDNVAGMPPGSFAVFQKVHHAAIDGATGVEMMQAVHDLGPVSQYKPHPSTWKPEKRPTELQLLRRAAGGIIKQPVGLVQILGQSVPMLRRVREGVREEKFRMLGSKERTLFNAAVSPHRVIGATNFSLAEVIAIKNSVEGATVNDAMLSIMSGGLRKYLQSKKQLPAKSLVSGAPVNVRSPEEKGAGGNVVAMMSISLCSDVADPVERLRQVHAAAVSSKAYLNAVGARLMTDWSNKMPARVAALGLRAVATTGLLASTKPVFNTALTNVPGPQVPLYFAGARLLRNFGVAPIMDGVGLVHVVTSYAGQIGICFQSCRDMMPDPGFYERCLYDSFDELRAATMKPGKPASTPAKRVPKPTRTPARKKSAAAPAKAKTAARSAKTRTASKPAPKARVRKITAKRGVKKRPARK